MRIGIIQFPGSNCERETMLAVKRAGMEPVEFLWNQPKELLAEFDGYIIVGGFSYEDRSRSGIIAALDPIMAVLQVQSELGKPILGICNGAQILVETGLVPGLDKNRVGMALTDNKRMRDGQVLGTGFYNTWVNMRLADEFQYNAFTRHLTPKDILHIPIAHGEGRFVIPPALLKEIQVNGLNVFQYCDADGNIIDEFPINPNGSINNIAAISNKAGNVMAMMPHPERTTNGDAIFKSMHDYIAKKPYTKVAPLAYQALPPKINSYQTPQKARELIIDLVITDNQAMSVANVLNHSGMPVQLKRQVHWEITCDSEETYQKILASGVLFNDRKEMPVTKFVEHPHQVSFLVRAKDDIHGMQKQQMLEHHFNIQGIESIQHSVLWHLVNLENTTTNKDVFTQNIINSHILMNPYAYDCYYYGN